MSKIAVDIALLLDQKVTQLCIDLNNKKDSGIFQRLNSTNSLPHISLALGVIDNADLLKAGALLEGISKDFSQLDLQLTEIYSKSFRVKITPALQNLHDRVMQDYSKILKYDQVDINMFYSDPSEDLDEISCYWVKNFPQKSFENFSAHISLKCKNIDYNDFPVDFYANNLVLCHLGNFCSCRKVLIKFKLR